MTLILDRYDFDQIIERAAVASARTDYSGRFMHGDTCIGIVGDASTLVRFVQAAATQLGEITAASPAGTPEANARAAEALREFLPQLSQARSDNMGLETIYYWPGVQVTDQ